VIKRRALCCPASAPHAAIRAGIFCISFRKRAMLANES